MSERLSEPRLVALLEAVAPEIEFPPTPEIAARVSEDLSRGTPRAASRWLRINPALAGAVAIVAGLVTILSLSASARRAAADLLEVVGIHIEFEELDTPGLPGPELSEADLGRSVTASEAQELARFPLLGPKAAEGPARHYFESSVGDSGMFSTVFETSGGLRLVTEFEASVDAGVIKKLATGSSVVRSVVVGSAEGYWLTGDVHVFGYLDAGGGFRQETVRLAGNVLIWDHSGVTYRIEGALTQQEALGIAGRMGF